MIDDVASIALGTCLGVLLAYALINLLAQFKSKQK